MIGVVLTKAFSYALEDIADMVATVHGPEGVVP